MDDVTGRVVERLGRRLERERRARLEAEAIAEQATRAALHDSLTGLPNRALILDRLNNALARAERHDGHVVLFFVDLDRFKLVNDSLGHDAGDKLLVEVATRLVGVARTGDTVGRFGGDEFVVLCEGVADRQAAEAIATRVADAVAAPVELGESVVRVSASIGVALATGDDVDADGLVRDGDAAMYYAKDSRNRVEVFEEGVRDRDRLRLRAETDLRLAVEQGSFELHYQPIVRLDSLSVVSVEPLVRWRHPDRGLVPPLEFIPLAEETGLIGAIGRWVLRNACAQILDWRERFGPAAVRGVSVNLSAVELLDSEFADTVVETVRSIGFAPSDLTFEVTESVLIAESEVAHRNLQALRAAGIRLAIDDFGTGYSSLAYLRALSVDALKIHHSFVAGITTSAADYAIVQAIVLMARALGLDVVAEGVEAPEQLERLVDAGCGLAQGYFFGAPVPAEEYGRVHLSGQPWRSASEAA